MSYKVIKYPDGQISVKVESFDSCLTENVRSYEDLFRLKSISDAYKHNGYGAPDILIPCLFGQQSDRRFDYNESFDLKNICEFINSCDFQYVRIFHPHSDSSVNLLNNGSAVPPNKYINNVTQFRLPDTDLTLVSPDAGAYKWVFKIAEEKNLPLVAANKFRDREGNITLNFSGNVGKNCLILDDLILNGGTFKVLASKLKESGAEKIYLYVSHFIANSNDYKITINNLKGFVDHIYTTNSIEREYDEEDNKFLTVYTL